MTQHVRMGSYLSRRSPVHDLDARVKLALLLLATVALFASATPYVLALFVAVLALLAQRSGMSLRSVAAAVRPAALVLAFVVVANALRLDGSGEVALVGPVGVSPAGAARGLLAVGRIIVLVGLTLVVTATSTPTELADALVWALSPLRALGVPVTDVAMVVSIALRFLPVCASEFDRIVSAQRARGVDFDSGGLVVRLRRWAAVLVPVIVALFRHADCVADAMRDRCYRGEGRTSMRTGLTGHDKVILCVGCAVCVFALVLGRL